MPQGVALRLNPSCRVQDVTTVDDFALELADLSRYDRTRVQPGLELGNDSKFLDELLFPVFKMVFDEEERPDTC